MQRRNKINHAKSAQHAPRTSYIHSTKPKSAMMKTHQTKIRQSCRKNRAVKAGNLIDVLRMTRNRQMQRRNNINHATSAPHAPRTSHTHTPQNKTKVCNDENSPLTSQTQTMYSKVRNDENSPNEAQSILKGIPRHQGWEFGCRSAQDTETSDA
jgi:hypothetical protein